MIIIEDEELCEEWTDLEKLIKSFSKMFSSIEKYLIDYNFNNFQFKLPTLSHAVYNKYISFDITINSTIVGGQKTTLTFIIFVSIVYCFYFFLMIKVQTFVEKLYLKQ